MYKLQFINVSNNEILQELSNQDAFYIKKMVKSYETKAAPYFIDNKGRILKINYISQAVKKEKEHTLYKVYLHVRFIKHDVGIELI